MRTRKIHSVRFDGRKATIFFTGGSLKVDIRDGSDGSNVYIQVKSHKRWEIKGIISQDNPTQWALLRCTQLKSGTHRSMRKK